jgi:hypothetical protein
MGGEFYAKLGIFSTTLTPSELDSIIGIRCDKGYIIGDLRGHTIIREKENGWIVYSRISRDASLESHVKDLLERVGPVVDKIRNIADQPGTEVELGCVIHSKEEPPLFFTKEMIATLCQMGASVDVDLYFYDRRKN